MKKNFRVIQINGFRGLLMAFFTVSCLIAGFVVFPAFINMSIWNYLATTTSTFPEINIYQCLLLWAIIAFSIFIFNKRKLIVSFNAQQELSDAEVREIVSKIKTQTLNSSVMKNFPRNELNRPNLSDMSEDKNEQKEVVENKKD